MTKLIDDATLAKLDAVEKKATPGPWDYDGQHNEIITPTTDAEQYWLIVSECRSAPDQTAERDRFGHHYDANFDLMVQSRNALPDLLATVRALKAQVEKLDEEIRQLGVDKQHLKQWAWQTFGPRPDPWGRQKLIQVAQEFEHSLCAAEEAPCPTSE